MKIRSCLFVFLMAMLIMQTSCFPSGQKKIEDDSEVSQSSDNSSSASNDVPDSINKKINDNFLVDAKVVYDMNLTYHKSVSVKQAVFDLEKAKALFAPNKEILEEYSSPSGLGSNYETKSLRYDDRGFSLDIGSIYFALDILHNLDYSFEVEGYDYFLRKDIGDIYTKSALESLDKNQAIDTFFTALEALNISASKNDLLIYALDYETMMSRWEPYMLPDETPATPWSKDDEAYVLSVPILVDGVKITTEGYINSSRLPIYGSRIVAIVRKEGLAELSVFGMYDIGEKSKDTIDLISLDTAISRVAIKYKDILLDNPITAHKISLEYLPINENEKYILKPVWTFELSEKVMVNSPKGSFESVNNFSVFVSAETGEEIVTRGKA